MRERKQRAWLHDQKMMVQVAAINYIHKYIEWYDTSECKDGAEEFDLLRGGPNAECTFESCDIVDYTGLTDRNGKEIYEGDIVTQKRSDKPYSDKARYEMVKMVVSWYDGLAYRTDQGLELNPKAVDNPSWFNECPKFRATPTETSKFTHHAWSGFHNCEVIGNIYESPHLLDKA